jgi:hypothetical protein
MGGLLREPAGSGDQALADGASAGAEAQSGATDGRGGSPPDGLFTTTFDQGGGDRENLVRFLQDLERLLRFVAENPQGLVPDELHGHLGRAWETVQRRFPPAIAALQEIGDPALEAAGLAGPELRWKLEGVGWGYRGLQDAIRRIPGARRAPGALAAVLGLADVVGDSIPVIKELIHPILEHKQLVEKTAGAIDAAVG